MRPWRVAGSVETRHFLTWVTMLNLVIPGQAVSAYNTWGVPSKFGRAGARPLECWKARLIRITCPTPTRLNMPNLTRCWSNGTILSAKIRRKHWAHRVPPFKIIQGHRVTFDDTNRSDTYDFLLMIQSNYGPIVQRFRYNRRFQF